MGKVSASRIAEQQAPAVATSPIPDRYGSFRDTPIRDIEIKPGRRADVRLHDLRIKVTGRPQSTVEIAAVGDRKGIPPMPICTTSRA